MTPKYKATGCARFFVFLVIFLPIVFFGAAYLRGENGVKIIKDYYHQLTGKSEGDSAKGDSYDPNQRVKELEKELHEAKEKIRELEQELKDKEAEKSK
jgi:hypothetical protein